MQKVKYITLLLILSLVALTAYCSRNNDKNIKTPDESGKINHPIIDEQADTNFVDVDKDINNNLVHYDRNPGKEYTVGDSTKDSLMTAHIPIPQLTSFGISRDSSSIIIDNYTEKEFLYHKRNSPYAKASQKTSTPHMETEAKGVSLHNYIIYDLLSVLVPLGVLMLFIFILLPLYFCKK